MTELFKLSELTFDPLPEGYSAVGAAALVKCVDDMGDVVWSFRTSESLNDEEVLGALVTRLEITKAFIHVNYVPED